VRLKEASPITGGLVFDLSTEAAPRLRQGGGKKRRER
jgi:hypothetical protein